MSRTIAYADPPMKTLILEKSVTRRPDSRRSPAAEAWRPAASGIRSAPFRGGHRLSTRADYLDFDTLLTEEQRLVRDTVGDFVDERVLPIIEEAAWEGRFPKELVPG